MSTGADEDGGMGKLNVKVPKRLLEEIDELAEELEYTNRSEFVREVFRNTAEPILTAEVQEGSLRATRTLRRARRCPQARP